MNELSNSVRRLVRLPFQWLPAGFVVRVPVGPMRGMRWIAESMPHGAWLGRLERRQLEAFLHRIDPGMTVWDVGANVGLYTVPSARRARSVFAFEPVARNAEYLRRHVALNRLANVHVIEAAVTDRSGDVRMAPGASPSEASLDTTGPWVVPALALDDWRGRSRTPMPGLIKIDVEGAEDRVLAGASRVLAAARPTIFVALHGERQRQICRSILDASGYRIASLNDAADLDHASEWIAEWR